MISTTLPLLQTTHLTKSFGGMRSIVDVSLQVHSNECVGIIGPNGAGKTTLFNLFTGIYTPTSGDILWQGELIQGMPPNQIARLGMARTFQNIRLFKQLSVLENVRIAYDSHLTYGPINALFRGRLTRTEEKKSTQAASELLAMFGMGDLIQEQAGSLPYGFQRRLEIARALALNPRLLLLDEPVAGMNENEMITIIELLRWVQKEFSSTLILIEHHIDFVMELCNRLLVLNFGSILAEGAPAEVRNDRRVIEAYLGTEEEG
ncbi:MAG: high-affinity branched-chain amino acid ABC transporter ATP-binding protein LivG [Verrucomicrobia bacterium RIFCSPHIGHO2_12_FULL_41_10]|nr:MAG: high-affinity branched-chain amino acid ABC transporter ATP-binding protein LivG [Verrucomicrobia bacterium RIFCSPHIGHO2_12_FULL_41_10]HLB32659.1 ABC transporter ATP-binding protein [Chthoniobacterales bacterium]